MDKDFGVVFIRENQDYRVKITMNEFNNKLYIHIRDYGIDYDTGILYPTKKGITIPPEEVDSVIEVLQKVSNTLSNQYRHLNQFKLDDLYNKEDK